LVAHASALLPSPFLSDASNGGTHTQRPLCSLLLCADKGICVQVKGAGLGNGIWWKRRRVCAWHGWVVCLLPQDFPPFAQNWVLLFWGGELSAKPKEKAQTTYIMLNLARYRLLVRSFPPSRSLIPKGHALSVKRWGGYNVQEKEMNGQALSALSMRSNKSFSFFSFWLLLISTRVLNTLTLCQFSN
jgi:hypothetical protein